jgi:hypothetical protein
MPIATGSRIGDLSFSLSTEPFRAGLWPGVRASGSVSRAGDVFDLTPEDVRVTGASHVIDLTISTEYWNTEGLEEYPAWTDESDGVPPGAAVKFWSYGDDDAYELVSLTPGFPDACTLDPAVDQASIQRSDEPFSRLRFRLTPGSDTIARQRVSDCLIPGLSRGTTLIIFDPFTEPGRS